MCFLFNESTKKIMKKTFKLTALILSVVMLIGVMCACSASSTASLMLASNDSDQDGSDLVGEWIDLDDDTITFNEDGTCDYFGTACDSYTFDGSELVLTSGDQTVRYEARLFSSYFVIFYEPYTYTRVSGNSGELEGEWESNEGYDYSFSFADGKFTEDGSMTGTYAVDGEEIMFIYDDTTDGAYLFNLYEVDGDELYFYYGWALWQE